MVAPTNYTCTDAIDVGTFPVDITIDTTLAPADANANDDDCGSGNGFNAVWFKWVADTDEDVKVNIFGTTPNNDIITQYHGSCGALIYDNCSSCAVNPDFSDYIFTPVIGVTYYWVLTTYVDGGDTVERFTLELNIVPPTPPPEPTGQFCTSFSCDNEPFSGLYQMVRGKTHDTLYAEITFGDPPTFILIDRKIP